MPLRQRAGGLKYFRPLPPTANQVLVPFKFSHRWLAIFTTYTLRKQHKRANRVLNDLMLLLLHSLIVSGHVSVYCYYIYIVILPLLEAASFPRVLAKQ
jgi:hypothetical protein